MEQNNTSKQKVGLCDRTTLQIFFIFTILNTCILLIFHAKIQPKISSGIGEEVNLLFLLYLVTAAIFDILPDPILQF